MRFTPLDACGSWFKRRSHAIDDRIVGKAAARSRFLILQDGRPVALSLNRPGAEKRVGKNNQWSRHFSVYRACHPVHSTRKMSLYRFDEVRSGSGAVLLVLSVSK